MICLQMLFLLGAYLIGSIPVGFLIAYGQVGDIRRQGSGNIGATNVARILGKHYFIPVFLLDAAKAAGYLFFLQKMDVSAYLVTGGALLIMVGNGYSLFLRGDGGKGIASLVGILLILERTFLLIFISVWVLIYRVYGNAGGASIGACFVLLIGGIIGLFCVPSCTYATLIVLSAWCLYRHKNNMRLFLEKW